MLERKNLERIIFLRASGQLSLKTDSWQGQINAIKKQTQAIIRSSEGRLIEAIDQLSENLVKVAEATGVAGVGDSV